MKELMHSWIETPLGDVLATADDSGFCALYFRGQKWFPPGDHGQRDDAGFTAVRSWLEAYFCGDARSFPGMLAPRGTEFQRNVWAALSEIPFGETKTYTEIAARIGRPSAVRAVAAAIGKNPLSLIVPCHRVIGADGSLTGFAGGLERKQWLLTMESAGKFRLR